MGQERFGALQDWPEPVLAGRVAHQVGAPRTGRYLHLRTGRREPDNREAQFFYGLGLLESCGPWRTHLFIQERDPLFQGQDSGEDALDWLTLKVMVLTQFRDFVRAHELLALAWQTGPDHRYLACVEANLLRQEDRREDALEAIERSLERFRWYRPSVQNRAELLESMGRFDEAIEFLREAEGQLESCWILAQLGRLLVERDQHKEALEVYQRFDQLAPLKDKDVDQWLNQRRFHCYYDLGQHDKAVECLGDNPSSSHRVLLQNLRDSPPEAKVKKLSVGLVRQHHLTCAPATLSAIGRFWEREADHGELAEEICYDGTPTFVQRRWAEKNGWVTKEFTVDWPTTLALIDAGIPFTLTTVDTNSSHLQAVVGYDERLRTLLLRDPSVQVLVEMLADRGFEKYAFSGPHGMLLVPEEESSRLEAIDLPDWQLHQSYHSIACALDEHNRARADRILRELQEQAPEHRVTQDAELLVAWHDEDLRRCLQVYETKAERFPESQSLTYRRLSILRNLGREAQVLELLEEVVSRPDCDPIFLTFLGEELLDDASQYKRAERFLLQGVALRSSGALTYHGLAQLRWKQRRFSEALELKRISSCLDDKNEGLARSFFSSCMQLEEEESALEFLRQRYQRYGAKNSGPGRTLYWALESLFRTQQARELLDQLLERFPEDPELVLFAARSLADYGEFQRASQLLEHCRHGAPELDLLRAHAYLDSCRGEIEASLKSWQMIVRREPSTVDAHQSIVAILMELERGDEAISHLQSMVEQFPHNIPLRKILYSTARRSDPELAERALKGLLEVRPQDSWSWSRLALLQIGAGREQQARDSMGRALALEPDSPDLHHSLALIEMSAGELERAREECRKAIDFSLPEAVDAMVLLLELTADQAQAQKELDELWRRILSHKGHRGQAVAVFRGLASNTLKPQELLERLESFRQGRELYPEEWVALIKQAEVAGQSERAFTFAEEASGRFPYSLELCICRADLHREHHMLEQEKECLERALAIEPTSGACLRRLGDLYTILGDLEMAQQILTRGVVASPQDSKNHGYLAEVQWLAGQRQQAVASIIKSIQLDPGYLWAWQTLQGWAAIEPSMLAETPLELAQRLAELRPRSPRSWLNLAEALPREDHQGRLEALNKALEIAPLHEDAHEGKICLLAELERYEEALQACHPEVWGERPPAVLRARRCWVLVEQGNFDEGLSQLRELLLEEPNLTSGWFQYYQWLRRTEESEERLRAAHELVRVAPDVPRSYMILGWELEQAGEDPRSHYRRAAELDPSDQRVTLYLMETSLEHKDGETLRSDFGRFSAVLEPDQKLFFQIATGALVGDWSQVPELLTALACTPDADYSINRAVAYCREGEQSELAFAALREAGLTGRGQLRAGIACAKLLGSAPEQLKALMGECPRDSEFCLGVLGEYVGQLEVGELKKMMKTQREWLRSHTYPWASVASRWMDFPGAHQKTILTWTEDWRERDNLRDWMLLNRSVSLRDDSRYDEARDLDLWVLENMEPGDNWSLLQVMLFFDFLRDGEIERARFHCQRVDFDGLAQFYQTLYCLCCAWLSALDDECDDAKHNVAAAREIMNIDDWDDWLRLCHRQALKQISSRFGGRAGHFWMLREKVQREKTKFSILGGVLVAIAVAAWR